MPGVFIFIVIVLSSRMSLIFFYISLKHSRVSKDRYSLIKIEKKWSKKGKQKKNSPKYKEILQILRLLISISDKQPPQGSTQYKICRYINFSYNLLSAHVLLTDSM